MLRPISNTAILTAAMLFVLPGCSALIANRGISGVHEIPAELSRKEVQERFGSPGSVGTTSLGRQVEIYHLRQKFKGPSERFGDWWGRGGGGGFPPGAGVIGLIVLVETVSFPMALAESEKNKLEVVFVYGPDDRVLYFYEPKAEPSPRYYQALRTLTHPLSSETELAKCASAKDCMERYTEEVRKRAIEVEYTLTEWQKKIFQADLKLAREIDEDIKKEDTITLRRGSRGCPLRTVSSVTASRADLSHAMNFVTDSLLVEIKQVKYSVYACVSAYVREVLRRVSMIGETPTPADEETFQEELEIAADADEGKITRDEAYGQLRAITTRHLILSPHRLYW